MLTVIREMADAVAEQASQWLERAARSRATADDEQNALLAEMLATALFAGEEALGAPPSSSTCSPRPASSTPAPSGCVVIVRGMVAGLAGQEPVQLAGAALRRRAARPGPSRRLALPLLHELHRHRRELDPRAIVVRGSRSSATRSLVVGDAGDAQGPRPHRRPRAGEGAVSPGTATCTSEDIADMRRAGRRAAGAARRRGPGPGSSRSPAATGCAELFAGRGRAGRRRRADAQPVDQRDLLDGHRGDPRPRRWSCCRTRRTSMAAEEAARLRRSRSRRRRPRPHSRRGSRRWSGSTPPRRPTENAERLEAGLEAIRDGAVAAADRDDADGPLSARRCGRLRRRASWSRGAEPGSTLSDRRRRARRRTPRSSPCSRAPRRRLALASSSSSSADGAELEIHDGGQPELLVADRRPVTRWPCSTRSLEAHGGAERWRGARRRSRPGSAPAGC